MCSIIKQSKGKLNMAENARLKARQRNFATIVYPDSAPDNWLDILRDMKVNCFVSPLHNEDVNPDGEIKKPHYHVLVMFDSPKAPDQFLEFITPIHGVGIEKVNSIRGYARYLCHLDNPEKAQYDKEDVICIGSCDYLESISLSSDRYGVIRDMIDFCNSKSIILFSDLLLYASQNNETWFRCLCDNGAYVMKEYLKSKDYGRRADLTIKVKKSKISKNKKVVPNKAERKTKK